VSLQDFVSQIFGHEFILSSSVLAVWSIGVLE
jgi:hypothetical protein